MDDPETKEVVIRGDLGACWQFLDAEIESEQERKAKERDINMERKQAMENAAKIKSKVEELLDLLKK